MKKKGLTNGDVKITYGNYLYFWGKGATANDEDGNWRMFCNASGNIEWEYYDKGAWVSKEEWTP